MREYAVLLNETTLGVAPTDKPLPTEFFTMLQDVKYYPNREEALIALAANLNFDDMYEFRAEYGLVDGKVYHRQSKKERKP